MSNTIRLNLVCAFIAFFGFMSVQAQEISPLDDPKFQRVEPFQVFDNLYYVGAKWVSAWVLETDQGLILFDSLYGELTDIAIDGIRDLGMDPNDIRYLIVSHAHFDHIGGARRIQDEFGAVVLMTDEDWQMTDEPAIYREYPKPIRHLTATHGGTLNLGREKLTFMKTPGHTTGVLSTSFTVYDNGYPHAAVMFGGAGLNFDGVERTQMYLDSIAFLQSLEGVEVNIPNHQDSGEVFERLEKLVLRGKDAPHSFVDPEGWTQWLDELLAAAEEKMADEQAKR
ncbi:MAG: MBL fold metallo-hydrolase [Gammaproteobacteria bacterium]|jgi:metallo-beta-lactamase class B|nr:MBL fold metallo-hydrolase [Gammaproteobacteria bacterium]